MAVIFPGTGRKEIWVYDLEKGTSSKIVTRGVPTEVRWWPDNRRVVLTEVSGTTPYSTVTVRQLVESTGERDTLGVDWWVSDIARDKRCRSPAGRSRSGRCARGN